MLINRKWMANTVFMIKKCQTCHVGRDEHEASSPSFFSVSEVDVPMDDVKKLLQMHGKRRNYLTNYLSDIGTITPYRKQV